uniref:FABP domain-containing protein n=1 Tax=Globodera pallida TaxID=36090 RepID=A0A183CLX1_GLOPA
MGFNYVTLCFLASFIILNLASVPELPPSFLHSWSVDHSENFDAYLEAKGYGWFMRQVVKMASITKTFSKNKDGSYACKIDTSKKDVEWPKFKLGVEFQAEYLDESQHLITFDFNPATQQLTETHKKIGSDEKPDIYKYTLEKCNENNDCLVMEMEYDGVKTKRFYLKNDSE